jgi:hypothetical protein
MKGEVDQLHKKKSIRQRQWNSYDDGAAPPVGVWWTTTFLRFFSKSHVKIKNPYGAASCGGVWWTTTFLRFFSKSHVKIKNPLIPSKNLKKEHFLIE